VAKVDDQLVVGTGPRRRALPLPRHLAHLHVVGAKLDGASLVVRFARGEVA